MSSRRTKIWVLVPVALATVGLMPAVSNANPLLSGYGGPGQGDQAILGATLLGAPGGGGGSSSSGSGETTAAALTVSSSSTTTKPSGSVRHHRGKATRAVGDTSTASKTPSGSAVPAVAVSPAADTGSPLGISAADIIYLLLALAALALTAVLMRQLARRPTSGGHS